MLCHLYGNFMQITCICAKTSQILGNRVVFSTNRSRSSSGPLEQSAYFYAVILTFGKYIVCNEFVWKSYGSLVRNIRSSVL